AVGLGEFGPAPRFAAAVRGGEIAVRDTTCPAIHAALQASEKGVPFLPLRGLIGSDLLRHRPDWRVIDNPFANHDPIVLLPADVMSRLIGTARHVAVGAQSPLPAAAAILARARGGGRPVVSILESRSHTFFTDGGRELFDCAGQGRLDVFFLSGAQIDGEANINLVSVGDYRKPNVRFSGSFGSAYLYFLVPRVI